MIEILFGEMFKRWCAITFVLFGCCFGLKCKICDSIPRRNISDQEVFLNSEWLADRLVNKSTVSDLLDKSPKRFGEFDISNRIKVIELVLGSIPDVNSVFPSEQYFYFKFAMKERVISGNFRFCESSNGTVHFGYFDVFDRSCSFHGALSESISGVAISKSGNKVTVSVNGIKREFVLIAPKLAEPPPLRTGERIVSPVFDESGYNFALIYSSSIPRFLFVLDGNAHLPERVSPLAAGDLEFFVGHESRYIFFKDENRLVLCGVLSDSVERNDYFDGPFDQVPPNLHLRSEIEMVYPYVKSRGGIDDHGNFLEQAGVRVAISPYIVYSDTSQFLKEVARRIEVARSKDSTFLSELVYEWKTDFLRSDGLFGGNEPGRSLSNEGVK